MANLKAVILVGGPSRGTRFRPLSLTQPKPLFPIAGFPLVHHHVAALAAVPDMKEILLIGFFEPNMFQRFLNEASVEFPRISIRYLREYQSLGTGGGLYHFRDLILRGNPSDIFVLNSDVVANFDLVSMLRFHHGHNGSCTILGTKVPKDSASRYGCIVSNSASKVLHYVEKPETFVSDLISCGVYVFKPEVFKEMEETVKKHHSKTMIADTEGNLDLNPDLLRLEQDILRPLAGTDRLFVFETKEFWRQVKTAGSALLSNKLYLYQFRKSHPERLAPVTTAKELADPNRATPQIVGDVFIHPTASIHPTAKLGPNVSIGPRVVIGRGVRVKDSIILDNVEIKQNSCVLHSIIGWGGKLGAWCRIEGTPEYAQGENVSPASNISDLGTNVWTQPITDLMLPNGMKNASATIFGENVTVSDELVIRNCIVLPHKDLKNSFKNEILM